jgi:hypothetical protein
MTAHTPITSVGPAMIPAGLPVRLRLSAGPWEVGFQVQRDSRTVVEVTDLAGSLIGLAASTRLPLVSIDAAWSGQTRNPSGGRQWWALAIGHAQAGAGPSTAAFIRRRRRARRSTGHPPEVVDGLWVAWEGVWAAAAIGRYTAVRLTAQSTTHVRRLRTIRTWPAPDPSTIPETGTAVAPAPISIRPGGTEKRIMKHYCGASRKTGG